MELRLTVLDRYGIDLQVLTLCFPMVGGLEPEEEVRLARLANDGLAEIVQRYPQRFLGVATLPFSSPAEALREFDRCVDSPGFKGLQISSNVNGTLLDAPELFPIYERAAQRGLPMWIHPTTPVTLDLVGTKGNADLLFGWPLDTSLALFRLVIGGVLEKLPQLQVIVHHLGAGLATEQHQGFEAMMPPVWCSLGATVSVALNRREARSWQPSSNVQARTANTSTASRYAAKAIHRSLPPSPSCLTLRG